MTRIATCALFLIAACGSDTHGQRDVRGARGIGSDSMGTLPTSVRRIAVTAPRSLKENSTAVITAAQPSIVFTINDSGNEPELFALDTTGATRGVWRIANATDVDWEAMSAGPCAIAAAPSPSGRRCLYIADTGDNFAFRSQVSLYRVAEPEARHDENETMLPSEKLSFRYPDQAHDVEAVYTTQLGDTYVITKRKLKDGKGRFREALVFRVAAAAWGRGETVVAELVDSLPIVPGTSRLREISDASLSHDSRLLAVRTYDQVYIFATDSATGRVNHSVKPAVCNIRNVERVHGEGVAWVGDAHELLLDSEGRNTPMFRILCPLPSR